MNSYVITPRAKWSTPKEWFWRHMTSGAKLVKFKLPNPYILEFH